MLLLLHVQSTGSGCTKRLLAAAALSKALGSTQAVCETNASTSRALFCSALHNSEGSRL